MKRDDQPRPAEENSLSDGGELRLCDRMLWVARPLSRTGCLSSLKITVGGEAVCAHWAEMPVGEAKVRSNGRDAMSILDRRGSRNRRTGAVLLAVLICLGIASAITGTALHRSLRARRQFSHDWQLEQTRLLLDAGIRRTHRNALDRADYVGESWILDGAFQSYPVARVEIQTVDVDELNGETVVRTHGSSVRFRITATIQNRDANPFQTKRSRVVSVRAANFPAADADEVVDSDDLQSNDPQ
tara:strand:- start:216 stop:944 length:729 start_codon:yes stop_codon:yes gene_type:complete